MELWSVMFVSCVLCLSISYTAEAINQTFPTLLSKKQFPALIMFGDSIVDTGSNNNLITVLKCNFPPYGKDFPGRIPTGRFSNGKVPSDFLAEELGISELLPSYKSPSLQPRDLLKGVNFASGGTGYDPLTAELVSVISLSEQLDEFKEYIGRLNQNFGKAKTNFILSKSAVVVVSGSNDIANTYYISGVRKLHFDISTYTDRLVEAASSFVEDLYGLGARKIGVLGAPPLGCVPLVRTLFGGLGRTCDEEMNMASKMLNSKLSAELQKLNRSLPQATVVFIQIYDPLLDIIQHPTKYGFEVVDRGCCGTGTVEVGILCNPLSPITCPDDSKYVFWDSFHPTQRTYQILVAEIIKTYLNNFS